MLSNNFDSRHVSPKFAREIHDDRLFWTLQTRVFCTLRRK